MHFESLVQLNFLTKKMHHPERDVGKGGGDKPGTPNTPNPTIQLYPYVPIPYRSAVGESKYRKMRLLKASSSRPDFH